MAGPNRPTQGKDRSAVSKETRLQPVFELRRAVHAVTTVPGVTTVTSHGTQSFAVPRFGQRPTSESFINSSTSISPSAVRRPPLVQGLDHRLGEP